MGIPQYNQPGFFNSNWPQKKIRGQGQLLLSEKDLRDKIDKYDVRTLFRSWFEKPMIKKLKIIKMLKSTKELRLALA